MILSSFLLRKLYKKRCFIQCMCGIVGYFGSLDCYSLLVSGLKNLEYRGYDSWGVAIKNKGGVSLKKSKGKITRGGALKGNIGIGHTRWATHGVVSSINSHPHHDSNKEFFVVHNGIVENFEDLKKKIKDKKYYSQTDSEVIAKIVAENKSLGFKSALLKTAKSIEGNFAIAAISRDEDVLGAVRNGSPLVVGFNEKEFFLASDVRGLNRRVEKYFFLEDGEAAFFSGKLEVVDFNGKTISYKKRVKDFSFEDSVSLKDGFDHFMHKEIHEQPKVVEDTFRSYFHNGFLFEQKIDSKNIKKILASKRIVILGCGTSWHAGLVSEYWFEKFCKLPVEVEYASEFRYKDPVIDSDTLVIAISQSGETADTIAAIKEAKKKKAFVISVVNVVSSSIDRLSDVSLYTLAGQEVGVASTKAFTTQLSVLFLFSLFLGNKRKTLTKKDTNSLIKDFEKVPFFIKKILRKEGTIKFLVGEYSGRKNALFLGRGVNFPIALEGALKLKEISYIHAEGYPAAEMKHGPIALIDKDMPSVFICVRDSSYRKILSNIEEVKARRGKVIVVATEKDKLLKNKSDQVFYVPSVVGVLTPFLTVIPLQLIAYHIAKKRGCEIDKPRNLAKSVTVE